MENETLRKAASDKGKLVSIVIPSWFTPGMSGHYNDINETYYVASRSLERLLSVTDRDLFELIIIDNGSTLKTEDIPNDWLSLESYWSKADKLIRNDENLGFGPAVNQGVMQASGEYIIQMNNDIIVFYGWLDAVLEVFEHDELIPPVGLVMPNVIKKEYQKDCLNEKNNKLDIEKVFSLDVKDLVLRNENIYERHAQFGSLWCLKKDIADKLIEQDGFFLDPQFKFAFKEDRDLYQRIYAMGLDSYRTNKTRVGHVGNLTVTKLKDRKQYTVPNAEKFEKKWAGKKM